ncbi:MAG: hypothetical protein H0V17_19720 [Deltaproteobacteria bacterium]|nr:hypothetical protein [Deltaproteobacteria bacterium]
MTEPWPRPNYTFGGQTASIALIALSPVRLPDPLPISRTKHGMPVGGSGTGISLAVRDRSDDLDWFVNHVLGPFAELISSDLGASAAATALSSEHAYVIECEVEDPDDLGHVQAAWALAKCVCEEGAAIVIDVYAARAHLGSDVAELVPTRNFDVMHEVTLFFDEQPDGKLAAWTLGLRKFGRPDLVLLGVPAETATDAALLLRDVAATMAAGERIEPNDTVETPDGRTLVATRFAPETSALVAVEGDALLLRAAD